MHGKPRAVHAEEEARHHRGAADEGPEQGGEVGQAAGEGEAPEGDRRQGEGGEDAGRVRGEVPLHAAGDGESNSNINNNCGDI